ncbi:MAG: hypothetical protein AB4372_31290, partial [Xenococcus sp. (in: cyanobacteria)]
LVIFLQSKLTQILTNIKEIPTNNNLKVGFLVVVLIRHKFFNLFTWIFKLDNSAKRQVIMQTLVS